MGSLHVKEKSYLHSSFNLLSIIPAPAKAVSVGKRRLKNHSFCLFLSSDTTEVFHKSSLVAINAAP